MSHCPSRCYNEGCYPAPSYPANPAYPSGPGCPPARRAFYIVSELNGKVLDVYGGQSFPGTPVIMFGRKWQRSPNQLWYLDETGCVRSTLNDFALDCGGQGEKVKVNPIGCVNPCHLCVFEGNRIVNRLCPKLCIDIQGQDCKDEANVIAWPYKGSANQHWRIEYA